MLWFSYTTRVETPAPIVFSVNPQTSCFLPLSYFPSIDPRQLSAMFFFYICSVAHPGSRPDVACVCADAFPLPYLLACRITFTRRVRGSGGSCETRRATLRRRSRRLVLTPGKRSGVFTYGRTSTCNFLLRFWAAPQTSFHYLPVPHRCFG